MSIYYSISDYKSRGVLLYATPVNRGALDVQFNIFPEDSVIHAYKFKLTGLSEEQLPKLAPLFCELHVGTPTLKSLLDIRLDPKNTVGIKRFGERLRKVIELYCASNLPNVTEVRYVHRD